MLLFRFVGSGFRLALCNVGNLATRKFVVLVPDPIVFAPWSVLLPHGRLRVTCQRTPSQLHRHGEQEGRLRRRRRDTGRSRRVAADCRRSGRNARRAGPRVARFVSLANLARQSHRPSTRVDCPTHECGWLLASATSSEDGELVLFCRNCLPVFPSFYGVCVVGFPLQAGNLIAAAVRKRRRRLQRVPSARRAEPTNSGADRC